MMKRAMSVTQVINKKRKLLPFEGMWREAIGCPELAGTWIIWGESGSGKTTFTMMLCKYLSQFGRVAYDSLEEGDSESIKLALIRANMQEAKGFVMLNAEPIDELSERLVQPKAPKIVVIDSVQYTQMTYRDYIAFKAKHRATLLIFISHAEGALPEGKTANKIRYDAHVKIRVQGYRAFITSRFSINSAGTIDIWPEMAVKYHGE
jgi:KaiC/GvpD/RAD55 family RecA-like ATPase